LGVAYVIVNGSSEVAACLDTFVEPESVLSLPLVRRDGEGHRLDQELTMEELRQLVADSRASGAGAQSVDDIFRNAERIAKARGILRE